jgi:acetylornithine deacetylase
MNFSAREMLDRLVAFPTVSSDSNLDLIAFVRDYLQSHGVSSTIVPSPDGNKANLWATIGPDVAGGIVLSGHTDVVPVAGQEWSSDPFTVVERGGKLYGRGTADMKGFDALCLALVPDMIKAKLVRPVHIALSYDEEISCLGAPLMVADMAARGLTPSAVIVGEPSRMKVVTGHKGSVQLKTFVRGKAVHSSKPYEGVSAILVASRLVGWLDDVMQQNAKRADGSSPFDPPYTTLHCGMIGGGTAFNITAQDCWFSTDIRAIPTETAATYHERYLAHIDTVVRPAMQAVAPEADIRVEVHAWVEPLREEADGAAEALCRRLTGDNGSHVVAYGTEAGIFQARGWSTVVCGPGDIAQAHQPDEFIEISEFQRGEAFLRRMINTLQT